MNHSIVAIILAISTIACSPKNADNQVKSPDGNLSVSLRIEHGRPYYSATYKGSAIINASVLGFALMNGDTLSNDMVLADVGRNSFNETWEQPWGEERTVKNQYNEMSATLHEMKGKHRIFQIVFRVFNDGLGFRYIIPEQPDLHEFTIMDELTEFVMADNYTAWWIPAYRDNRYEYLFTKSPINEMDTVHTPLTMVAKNGTHLSIHEANLTNYGSMTLAALGNNRLKCDITPWFDGTKVKTATPMNTPWRTVLVGSSAGDLVTSRMILNLNEPNKMTDLSWVKPMKYMGIWWGMHINKYTFWEGPNHGASTKRSIEYIDYCKEFGIDNLLIEGWNTGWTPEWYKNLLHVFNFTQCANDFDFKKVTDYARENHVNIVGYHETGANIDNYLSQIDMAMQMYKDAGMHSVKIGQVGSRMMLKEWHHGQYGVNYYKKVLDKAAEYQLAVNFHEPIKPTGLQRTYPSLMSQEGARGTEYDAWSEGNPPEHTVILPFTRLLGGPMDFTPGIFKIKGTRVHTTLAKQLAFYLTIYSPIQMLADLPENYVGHPAFKFLKDVPVNWETTWVINAEIGEYFTVARKDVNSNDWYLGSITNEKPREFVIDLTFLDPGKKYRAEIYADAEDAEFDVNPEAYEISKKEVDSKTRLTIRLAKGGGQAIRFAAL
jgi:alpha-glucosidase